MRTSLPKTLAILCLPLCLVGDIGSALAGDTVAPEQTAPNAPSVLVIVNGEPVTEAQILRRLKAVDPDVELHRDDANRWSRLLEGATEAEIRDRLLLQAARAEGLEIAEEKLSAALARSRELLGEKRFTEMLAQQNASEADYRAFLKDRLLIDDYRDKVTGDLVLDKATLRDYYRGHRDSFQAPARVRLEMAELTDAGLVDRVAGRLRGGEALAEIDDPDAGIRTMERWVNLRDLPPELSEQVEIAGAGDVLEPFSSGETTRVIRVGERQASRRLSFKESKELIRRKLLESRRQAALDDWYDRAKREARIEYP
jgi:parvulin-like peptidyl-prolyl isomerase